MNWWGIGFIVGVPTAIISALVALAIREHIADRRKARERDRRWHRPVQEWWEMTIK